MRIWEMVVVAALLALGVGSAAALLDSPKMTWDESLWWLIPTAVVVAILWFRFRMRRTARLSGQLHSPAGAEFGARNSAGERNRGAFQEDDLQVIGRETIEEGTLVISTEDVPLDNRHGSSTLVSEHEFTHTATASLEFDQRQTTAGELEAGLWSVLTAKARAELSRGRGVEVGRQITRRVVLRFEALPGKLVHYRVAWKQNRRRELLQVKIHGQALDFPYTVIDGLFHSVESVLVENA